MTERLLTALARVSELEDEVIRLKRKLAKRPTPSDATRALQAIYDYTEPSFLPSDGGPWVLTIHKMAEAALALPVEVRRPDPAVQRRAAVAISGHDPFVAYRPAPKPAPKRR